MAVFPGNTSGNNTPGGSGSNRNDPNESSVKVTPEPSNKVTIDSQKGYRNVEQGVITGTANQTVNDGYSHWMKDAKGWWLRFVDGTWFQPPYLMYMFYISDCFQPLIAVSPIICFWNVCC